MENDEQVTDGPIDEPIKGRKNREKSLEELEKEAHELLDHVGGGIIETVRDRVAFILNRYAEARNSDIELVWLYWKLFESEKFPGDYITKEHMFAFEQNAVIGERACKDSKSV